MPLHFARGVPQEPCGACGDRRLPRVHLYHPADPDNPVSICILCLGGAVELVTTWRVRTTFSRWEATSDVSDAFADLGKTRIRRGPHSPGSKIPK